MNTNGSICLWRIASCVPDNTLTSRRWALRATQPSGGPASSSSNILLLFRQQSHCQRVCKQHHAQRYVKADYAADQLVQRVRYLTGAVHQHRVVLLEHRIMHLVWNYVFMLWSSVREKIEFWIWIGRLILFYFWTIKTNGRDSIVIFFFFRKKRVDIGLISNFFLSTRPSIWKFLRKNFLQRQFFLI